MIAKFEKKEALRIWFKYRGIVSLHLLIKLSANPLTCLGQS